MSLQYEYVYSPIYSVQYRIEAREDNVTLTLLSEAGLQS